MTIKEALKYIVDSLQATIIAAVKTVTAHTFLSKISGPVKISNLPRVQKIAGSVAVQNQKKLENEVKKVQDLMKEIDRRISKLPTEYRITNLNDIVIPPLPAFPKELSIVGADKKHEEIKKAYKEIYECLEELKKTMKALPTKYPEVTIPEFPKEIKVLNFPEQLPFPKFPTRMHIEEWGTLPEMLAKYFKGKPDRYINARLTNAKEFLEPLQHIMGSFSFFRDSSGGNTRGATNSRSEILAEQVTYNLNDTHKVSATTTYIGQEDKAGRWLIQKVVKSGKLMSMRYASKKNNENAPDTYEGAWAQRTELSYGSYSVAYEL